MLLLDSVGASTLAILSENHTSCIPCQRCFDVDRDELAVQLDRWSSYSNATGSDHMALVSHACVLLSLQSYSCVLPIPGDQGDTTRGDGRGNQSRATMTTTLKHPRSSAVDLAPMVLQPVLDASVLLRPKERKSGFRTCLVVGVGDRSIRLCRAKVERVCSNYRK